jgi:hypothetical protein
MSDVTGQMIRLGFLLAEYLPVFTLQPWLRWRIGEAFTAEIVTGRSHVHSSHPRWRRDSPEPRSIQPPEIGSGVALPQVGGLHHRDERPHGLTLLNMGADDEHQHHPPRPRS